MHLIGLKDHKFFIFEFDHHGNMIEIAVREKALDLSAQMFCIKQKDISCFCFLKKLFLCQDIFVFIGEFIHSFQHQFLFVSMIIQDFFQQFYPFFQLFSIFMFEQQIFALAHKIQHKSFFILFELGFEQSEVDAADCLDFLVVFEPDDFFRSQNNVSLLSEIKSTDQLKKNPSVFLSRYPYFRILWGLSNFAIFFPRLHYLFSLSSPSLQNPYLVALISLSIWLTMDLSDCKAY